MFLPFDVLSTDYTTFRVYIKFKKEGFQVMKQESSYYDIIRRSEIKEENRRLRRLFLRYKEAEIVYSIQHKKLLELASHLQD